MRVEATTNPSGTFNLGIEFPTSRVIGIDIRRHGNIYQYIAIPTIYNGIWYGWVIDAALGTAAANKEIIATVYYLSQS